MATYGAAPAPSSGLAGVRFNRFATRGSVDSEDVTIHSYDYSETEQLVRPRRNCCQQIVNCLCMDWTAIISRLCSLMCEKCKKRREHFARTIAVGKAFHTNYIVGDREPYPANVIRNQKYTAFSFVPMVMFEQFKFFLNFYFLLMAVSQFIPEIRIGLLYTYWGPLGFVIFVTMCREAFDDIGRHKRDTEVNRQTYRRLLPHQRDEMIPSSSICVGDIIVVEKDQRVPADLVFLRTSEKTGACFIRTDQMDGETDWKLRVAVPTTQNLPSDSEIFEIEAQVFAEKPQRDIHNFLGTFTRTDRPSEECSLNIENTLWANTVIASGTAVGLVVYTGLETRSVMNTSQPPSKVGLLDIEVNALTKVLFVAVLVLSLVMMIIKGFGGPWYRYLMRFILLFSYIIPLSLRVNLDMGKLAYAFMITRDKEIPSTVVRSTTLCEDLGRIQYLFSDKTGTLTKNEMVFKKLHLGTVSYTAETMDEVLLHLHQSYSGDGDAAHTGQSKIKRTMVTRVAEAVKALALCHNVTPVFERDGSTEATYQASSPDEVALVRWTESVGLTLVHRDLTSMKLRTPVTGATQEYAILQTFPFTSETKRMGIIIRDLTSGEVTFYMKGADVIMMGIVQYNDWLEEECGNMAREGLRTLVVAKKILTEDQYSEFQARYHQAKMAVQDRAARMLATVESLERDMELLCLTGVEDKLQDNVRSTLELLKNAGIKIWMLTGDKLETATCIAKSSKLVSRAQDIHVFKPTASREEAHLELNALRRKNDAALIIRGDSLEVCLSYYEHEFVELACQCPAVIVCRCSPTQKADIVRLMKTHTQKRVCSIGDGGNDVSMIQTADVGIGIVGKEGKQASLAADFSVEQFSHIGRLLIIHGRNSYKRSAALSQFIMHRGLIITTVQAVFSSVFFFVSVSLFPGILMVGYATVYTMFPVFSLVFDRDVSDQIAMTYPELYKALTKGRSLNYKTFFLWILISIYQGGVIMYGALFLFDEDFIHVISITFTALVLTELLMVALTVRSWHWLMIVAELVSVVIYVASLVILKNLFDTEFLKTWNFIWKTLLITSVSCIPLYILKFLQRKFSPATYAKLQT